MSEIYTYPDGSQVYGVPPFPELSPIQRAEIAARERSLAEEAHRLSITTFEFDAPCGCYEEIKAAVEDISARYLAKAKIAKAERDAAAPVAQDVPRRGRKPKDKDE